MVVPANRALGVKDVRPAPFADEQPLFTITAANMADYADKLTEADKGLLQAYPEQFKMNVYKTHRTAAWPQDIYDKIKVNAATAELTEGGNGVSGVWGSIPFPIPQNGSEVIWNHMLRFQGKSRHIPNVYEAQVYNNGQRTEWTYDGLVQFNYYLDDPKAQEEGRSISYATTMKSPSRAKGEGFLVHEYLNPATTPRKAWVYDPGERRVRRAPNLGFDTPDREITTFDDYDLFNGSPERYDFKLVGKKEMYVPYNNDRLNQQTNSPEEVFTAPVANPDMMRYELHRVWVVEATVKEGQRHIYAKRTLYIDEDTWGIVATAKYDNSGSLWRVGYNLPVVAGDVPITAGGAQLNYDLKTGVQYVLNSVVGQSTGIVFDADPKPASFFSVGALRRRGK